MDVGDANAIFNMGVYYFNGVFGISQDFTKGLEFFHKAAELGCSKAYNSIGYAYDEGKGVGGDKKKAEHYYELAAIGGCEKARYNLGMNEKEAGNMDRALKHFMIAVKGGYAESLKKIQELYSNGHATKDDYTTALHAYQEYLVEIKSKQRDEAAAYDDDYRYY